MYCKFKEGFSQKADKSLNKFLRGREGGGQGRVLAGVAGGKVLRREVLDVFKAKSCLALLGSRMQGRSWWK